ncbi:MAG: class I SAM-dependent methyltransferase [Gemmatimonadales bacterium]
MATTATSFRPRDYWSSRVTGDGSLANVGHVALGAYNQYAYPLRLEALTRAVQGLATAGVRVFDGGFGEGVYLEYWRQHGAGMVSGLDFSPRAVAAARERYPDSHLVQGDLAASGDLAGFGQYDIVTAIDVLYHIVDDEAWARAVRNLLGLVGPGGSFIASDKFPREGAYQPMKHVRRRPLAMWTAAFREQGFEMVRRVPVFVLMDDPITCGSHPWLGQLAHLQWKVLLKLVRMAMVNPALHRATAALVAHAQLPVERLLLRRLCTTPNLELIVARRAPVRLVR